MNLFDPFISAGLVNIGLLAAATGIASVRDRRWAWLGAALLLSLIALGSIMAQHRTDGEAERVAAAAEQVAWAIAPLLFTFVRSAVGHRITRPAIILHFAAPALILAVGTPLILIRGVEPVPAVMLILYQTAYTAAAAIVFLRRPRERDRTMLGFWWPIAVIATFAGVHAGQLIRLSPSGNGYPDAVPIAASAAVILILLAGLALAHLFPRVGVRYGKSAMDHDEAKLLFGATKRMLTETGAFRRADLSLGELAAAMDVGPHHLSQSLSEGGGTSFAGLLALLRIEEAKRLLLEPANAQIAIEPLGMEAGFRSRSAFYASFRKHTGLTPDRFRTGRASFKS